MQRANNSQGNFGKKMEVRGGKLSLAGGGGGGGDKWNFVSDWDHNYFVALILTPVTILA